MRRDRGKEQVLLGKGVFITAPASLRNVLVSRFGLRYVCVSLAAQKRQTLQGSWRVTENRKQEKRKTGPLLTVPPSMIPPDCTETHNGVIPTEKHMHFPSMLTTQRWQPTMAACNNGSNDGITRGRFEAASCTKSQKDGHSTPKR
ncbi:hypothetical protein ACLKA7_015265 [Drosophila subpalustris]